MPVGPPRRGDPVATRLNRRRALVRLAALAASVGGVLSGPPRSLSAPAPGTRAAGRGSAGTLKLLFWQAPTILNPHLAQGTKDYDAARICTEPLLTVDAAGTLIPVLAAEVPSRANGQVAANGTAVTYRLRRDVRWADGHPFTADDVVFTFQFITHKATGATTYGTYANVAKVEPLGPYTVRITFRAPTPGWYLPFVGQAGQVLPRHALDAYVGDNAQYAPFNVKAFGTGPYKVDLFRPGDLVVYSINEYYRVPSKPAFQAVQLKGGGDAPSAARAVLETGEYDYAWNLQVEWPVLDHIAQGGKGVLVTGPGGGVEVIFFNMTDPNKVVDGQRASIQTRHPCLTDDRVRRALVLAVDRSAIARALYGGEGETTANYLTVPGRLASSHTRVVFDAAAANRLLDDAGYRRGPDGIRAKDGVKLQLTFATGVNTLRQKEQEIVKAAWAQLGVDTTLKAVDAGVFFSSAPGNPDTFAHFSSDAEMFSVGLSSPIPIANMARFYSANPLKSIAQRENDWSGLNFCRWQSPAYNALYDRALIELDAQKNADLWIRMNDMVVNEAVCLPLVDRRRVSARGSTIDVGDNMSPFDSETHNIADWKRTP